MPHLPPSPGEARTRAFWARSVDDPAAALRELYEEMGPIFRVFGPGGRHLTFLAGAEHAEHVMARDQGRLQLRGAFGYLDEIAPNCLLNRDGDQAMRLRRLIMAALRKDRIDSYLPMVVEETQRAFDSWPRGEPIEVAEAMRALTLRVALRAFLAVDVGDDELTTRVGRAITMTADYATPMPRQMKEHMRPAFLEAKAEVFAFIDEAIADRQASNEDRGDVLSALVGARDEDGTRMDAQELRENVWALMFAGHDTTAHATAWAFLLLAENEAVRNRAAGDFDELDRICRETLRLFPSAPALPRVVVQDFEAGEWTVPAGDLVVCPIFLTQRLPEYFDEPDSFRPERWCEHAPPKGAYTPFGIGPRWCPGMPFAMMEMKEILAAALRRFRFQLEPGQHIIAYATAPTTRPKPGIWMRFS